MASTMDTWDFALKEWYTPERVEDLCFSENMFLGLLPKNENMVGDAHPVPIVCGAPQGTGGTSLATVQGNASNVRGLKFVFTAGDYFGVVEIGHKVMVASRNNAGAYLENKRKEIDSLYMQMADDLSILCAGNGGGALGRDTGWSSGDTIQLADKATACNFEVNMHIVASDADGSGASDAQRSGSAKVIAVDRENGTITVDDIAGITGFAASDYLFREGNFRGNTGNQILDGIQSFIYSTSVSVPNLYSLVRTSDPTRLAGCRVPAADVSGLTIEQRLKRLGSYMTGRYKGKGPDAVILHPEDWETLETDVSQKGQRSLTDESTRFGYEYLSCTIGGKRCKIYQDKHFVKGTAFALRMSTWTLFSMQKLLQVVNSDGLQMLRKSTSNDFEYRLVSYPCLGTDAPGWNGRVALP